MGVGLILIVIIFVSCRIWKRRKRERRRNDITPGIAMNEDEIYFQVCRTLVLSVLSTTSLPLLSRHTFQLHLISLNLLEIFLWIQILAYIAIWVSCVFRCFVFVFVFWEDGGFLCVFSGDRVFFFFRYIVILFMVWHYLANLSLVYFCRFQLP